MKTITISGSLRANVGTKGSKELRGKGFVPCVLYGGKEQVHFTVLEKDFKPLLYTPDVHTVKLNIEGKEYNALLQEAQFHKVTDAVQHCDFLEIIPGKPVVLDIPVRVKGTAEGVREGGQLLHKKRYLKIKALAEKIPQEVSLDVTKMKIGNSIRVGDVKIEGVQLLDAPNITVVAVKTTRVVEEETPAAAATAAGAPAAGAAAPAAGAPAAAGATPAQPAAAAPAAAKKPEGKK